MSSAVLTDFLEKGMPFSREVLLKASEIFGDNRKNFTIEGKLRLDNSDLSNIDLLGVDLTKLDLTGVKLANTKLDRAGLMYLCTFAKQGLVSLNKVVVEMQDCTGIDFYGIDFSGASFKGSKFDRVTILSLLEQLAAGQISLAGADLRNVDLSGGVLKDQVIGLNTLHYIDLRGANFQNANLEGADFSFALLDGAGFEGANLSKCKFNNSSVYRTNFYKAILEGAVFTGVDMKLALQDKLS